MSQANSNAVASFTKLNPGWRMVFLISVREFTGNVIPPFDPRGNRNANAGELSRVVDVTFQDEATGQQIHKNYSLDKPSYLTGLLDAIYPGQGRDLIASIDWEDDEDIERLLGEDHPVLAKIYHEEWPANSGVMQNRIGATVSADTDVASL